MWQKQQVSESKRSTRMVVQASRKSSWCASFELLCRGWSEEPRLQLNTTYSYPCLATELEGKERFKSRACVKQQQPLDQDGNSPYI